MSFVTVLLTIIHVSVSLMLIIVVLLQTGKRADLAGAFGGGGSQTAFGTRGAATVLSKATTGAAIMFMVTSLGLSIFGGSSGERRGSMLEDADPATETSVPATPTDLPTPTEPVLVPDDAGAPAAGDDTTTEPPAGDAEPTP